MEEESPKSLDDANAAIKKALGSTSAAYGARWVIDRRKALKAVADGDFFRLEDLSKLAALNSRAFTPEQKLYKQLTGINGRRYSDLAPKVITLIPQLIQRATGVHESNFKEIVTRHVVKHPALPAPEAKVGEMHRMSEDGRGAETIPTEEPELVQSGGDITLPAAAYRSEKTNWPFVAFIGLLIVMSIFTVVHYNNGQRQLSSLGKASPDVKGIEINTVTTDPASEADRLLKSTAPKSEGKSYLLQIRVQETKAPGH